LYNSNWPLGFVSDFAPAYVNFIISLIDIKIWFTNDNWLTLDLLKSSKEYKLVHSIQVISSNLKSTVLPLVE
jgi:hypothetical protein